jgi:PAS domain S-box-containing protein
MWDLLPTARTWVVPAALALLAALFVADLLTGDQPVLVPIYVLAPLLAAAAARPRVVAAIAATAFALGLARTLTLDDPELGQEVIRLATVALGGGLAVWVAELRGRRGGALGALRTQTDRYEALLTALSEAGEGMVILEDGGRCVYANPAFEQLSGYAFPELAARESLIDLVVDADREEALRRARARVQQGLIDPEYELTIRRRDGNLAHVAIAGVPLVAEGREQIVVVVRDVTDRRLAELEREQALARNALLAEASELFDQTLDESRTVESVAQLVVRDLAQECTIVLGDPAGPVRRVASATRDPRGAAPAPDPDHPAVAVLRSGRSAIVGDTIVVPLRARGTVHGVLAATVPGAAGEAGKGLVALFEDLGRRAALALDNARLYEERSAIAHTLQRALLPAELPSVPGVEIAALYRPAGAGTEVGGDFYDAFPAGEGRWALAIGDVCGKGAEAATVTSLARHTLRAAVLHTARPSEVLGQLNEALLRARLDYRFLTAIFATLEPHDGAATVRLATGGHPLPLVLRADGRVEEAGAPGTLLGIVAEPELREATIELAAGDSVVLYTDGVVEASAASAADGYADLTAALRRCENLDAERIAAAVQERVDEVSHGQPRDDVAVLVVRVPRGPGAPFDALGQGVAAAT